MLIWQIHLSCGLFSLYPTFCSQVNIKHQILAHDIETTFHKQRFIEN